jgi:hypothetical protein
VGSRVGLRGAEFHAPSRRSSTTVNIMSARPSSHSSLSTEERRGGQTESEEGTHLQGLVKAELEADALLVACLDTGPVDVEQHCKQKTVHCWPS